MKTRNFFTIIAAIALMAGTTSTMNAQRRYRLGGEQKQVETKPSAMDGAGQNEERAAAAKSALGMSPAQITSLVRDQVADQIEQQKKGLVSEVLLKVPHDSHNGWHYALLGGILLIFVVMLIRTRKSGGHQHAESHDDTPAHDSGDHHEGNTTRIVPMIALAMLAFAGVSQAAVTCHTSNGEPAFFAKDGGSTDVVCTGVRGTKVEFSDSELSASGIKASAGRLAFQLTVGTSAKAPNEPDMLVDGKVVGHPIAVLSQEDAGKMDLMLRYLHGGGAASGVDLAARRVLEGMACPTGDAACLKKFRDDAWGNKKGTSTSAGAGIRASVVDQTLADPRLTKAMGAALDTFGQNLPKGAAPTQVTASVDNDQVAAMVDQRIAPLASAQQSLRSDLDLVKDKANGAMSLAVTTAKVQTAELTVAATGKKIPKATAMTWREQLQQQCAAAGVDCSPQQRIPAKKSK